MAQGADHKVKMRICTLALLLVAAAGAQAPAEGRIEGRVRDSRGKPVPAATIRVFQDDREIAKTACDAEGFFVAGGLRRFEAIVVASAPQKTREVTAIDGWSTDGIAAVDFRLLDAGLIRGTVTEDAGIPVHDALVVVDHRLPDVSSCRTADNGSFRLSDVPLGQHDILVWRQGYSAKIVPCELADELELSVVLQPDPGRALEFRIRGAGGQAWQSLCRVMAQRGGQRQNRPGGGWLR